MSKMTGQIKDIGSLLDSASPILPVPEVEEIAREIFGLPARASELTGERDRNFHLEADGSHYVLKVSNPAEDRQVIRFQTEALLHIAAVDASLPVPRVVPTRAGEHEWVLDCAGGTSLVIRILSFLEGDPLHRIPSSTRLRRNLGNHLARLDLALRGFFHPAAGHELMWDMKHASRVRDLLEHIPNLSQRTLAECFLDNFETHALPVLPRLRAQVIHNDLNPHNVLIEPVEPERIAGIIDFGDMVHAPLINNLAVAAAYQMMPCAHPLETAADLIAGYHAVSPLEPSEIDILFDLIATRMVLTVTITGWRAARYPENRNYILRNNPQAWAGLERLATLSRRDAQAYLHDVCAREEPS